MTKQRVLVLFFCTYFLGNQNEVYSNPANDIPKPDLDSEERFFEKQPEVLREKAELKRHQEELAEIGDKDPMLREEIDLAFRRRNRPWIDFEGILDRNVQEQNMMPPLRPPTAPPPKPIPGDKTGAEKIIAFRYGHFHLNDEVIIRTPKKKNWTSCEEFRKDAPLFVPDDIIGIKWVPFYQWGSVDEIFEESPLTVFTRATHSVVEHYYKKYGKIKSNYTVNWNKPCMLMRQVYRGAEMILIQGERNGLFYSILEVGLTPSEDEHDLVDLAFKIEITTMQMKIFENYLAMMYCEKRMALLMAREGFEPPTKRDKQDIGKRFKFRGVGRILERDTDKEKEIINIFQQQKKDQELLKNMKQLKEPTDDYPEYGRNSPPQSRDQAYYNKFNRFSGGGNKMTKGGWERFE